MPRLIFQATLANGVNDKPRLLQPNLDEHNSPGNLVVYAITKLCRINLSRPHTVYLPDRHTLLTVLVARYLPVRIKYPRMFVVQMFDSTRGTQCYGLQLSSL